MFRVPNAIRERAKEKRHSYWRFHYHVRITASIRYINLAPTFSRRETCFLKRRRLVSYLYCCVLANWDCYDYVSGEDIIPYHEHAGSDSCAASRDS